MQDLISLLLLCPVLALAAPQIVRPDNNVLAEPETLDGIDISRIPAKPAVAAVVAAAIPRDGWTVTCDSAQPGNDCSNALDGNADTFWLSGSDATLPQSIVVDMQTSRIVGNITIQPRNDGNSNGNIGQHQVFLRYVGIYQPQHACPTSYARIAKTTRIGVRRLQSGPTSTMLGSRLPSSHPAMLATSRSPLFPRRAIEAHLCPSPK